MPFAKENLKQINSSLFINNRLLPKISDIAFAKMKFAFISHQNVIVLEKKYLKL